MNATQILPCTGRGTMRSMVEEALHSRYARNRPPITPAFASGLPPHSGEDL